MTKKTDELIKRLYTDASDEDVELARKWLLNEREVSLSAFSLVEILLQNRTDTHKWISKWLHDKSWLYLGALAYKRSSSLFYWLTDLLESNPNNESAGRLWHDVLCEYNDLLAIDGATRWLVEHESDSNAPWVATKLLEYSADEKFKELAEDLFKRTPLM